MFPFACVSFVDNIQNFKSFYNVPIIKNFNPQNFKSFYSTPFIVNFINLAQKWLALLLFVQRKDDRVLSPSPDLKSFVNSMLVSRRSFDVSHHSAHQEH